MRRGSANVYVARANIFDVDFIRVLDDAGRHISNDYSEFSINLTGHAGFTLRRLVFDANGRYEDPEPVSHIRDFTRHNIILWESPCGTNRYHDYLYNQLNAVLTQILYDYLVHNGRVPLLNMVSHSTGGVLNMMWANRHPFNVHSLFSFGGPFDGTPMGNALYQDRHHPTIAGFGDMMGPALAAIRTLSGFDNMNPARHLVLRDDWQDAVNWNPNLRLHAIYAQQQMHMLHQIMVQSGQSVMSPVVDSILKQILGMLGASPAVLPVVRAGLSASDLPPNLRSCFSDNLTFNTYSTSFPTGPNVITFGPIYLTDDIIVSRDSARAQGFASPNNNVISRGKTFTMANSEIAGQLDADRHIAHALMYRDTYLINHVLNNITMDDMSPFYIRPVTGGVEITGLRWESSNGHITIPAMIGERRVVSISVGAFEDTGITSVTISRG